MSSDAKKDSIKGLLGDDMTLREFVIKSSGADENDFEQINFMSSYADELLLMHGKEKAAQILKSTANQVFTDDKNVFGDFPTIYSPTKIFPNPNERAVLLVDAVSRLQSSQDSALIWC